MIPKGVIKYFRGIVMVEILCKTITSLLNRQLMTAITFHDVLHGIWAVHGTGTADLESKLLQQLTDMMEAFLFKVFLDIWKSYDALYQERALELLASYGFGPRTVQLLRTYWNHLTMVVKAGKYFRRSFKKYLGVTQGDPMSPTISNVLVGAVIRHWVTVVTPKEAQEQE